MVSRPALLAVIGSAVIAVLLVFMLRETPHAIGAAKPKLVVYCAAGLSKAVDQIAKDYEAETGVQVQVEPDASNKLLTKLALAPGNADLFLAADSSYIATARKKGLIAEVIPVTQMRAAIAVQPGNPKKISSARDLLREDVTVALPNPELAAVGAVAKKALQGTGEWDELEKQMHQFKAKVSLTGTVTEAAQAVKMKAADAAIVWDATATQFGLDVVRVPAFDQSSDYAEIAVVKDGVKPTEALRFARYLTAKDRGGKVFEKAGFKPAPNADAWAEKPTLQILAGSMLRPAFDPVLEQFQKREGVNIEVTYNGCGILVGQMKAGLHPSAYFSCDTKFMNMVKDQFDTPTDVTQNFLVLLVPKGNPKHITTLDDLLRPDIRVGSGHPQKAALGELTTRMLTQAGLLDKLVASGNIKVESATGDFLVNQVRIGALDVAIVYTSNAKGVPDGLAKYFDMVPVDTSVIATQPFGVGKDCPYPQLVGRLREAVLAAESKARFESLGFKWVAPGAPAN